MGPGNASVGTNLPRVLRPGTWPVRWRLALASAGLTLVILLIFGGVIGQLASERVRSDFNREMTAAVATLASEVRIVETPTDAQIVRGPVIEDFARPNDAIVRIFDPVGRMLDETPGAVDLGDPTRVGIRDLGELRIATAALVSPNTSRIAGYVQYARSHQDIDSTISRLWLFIAAGVVGGTVLASLAGLAIANRAMRPIASLTSTAGEIADTRDPSRSMPEPTADDEVGELARTLEKMLRALDAAREESEVALQRQREFVADASHELRTPLTSVLANLELLQASLGGTRPSEDGEMVDSALRSSHRMSRLVADLLLLARADAGRTGERRSCDLASIARDAAAEVTPVSGAHSLNLEVGSPAGDTIPVRGNPDELHRMVLNLLDNAVSHTPENAVVELRAGSEVTSRRAWLEVADNGPGIPPQMREEVFDRFVRGPGPADTAPGTGSGLGLAIVRAVALSHGGEVELGQSPQGGALFRVELPLETHGPTDPRGPRDAGGDSRVGARSKGRP